VPINNTALYDSVIAAIAVCNSSWITDTNSSHYAQQMAVASAIASEIDSLIPPIGTGATLSQRALIESIVKSVMTGRTPVSVVPNDYHTIAQSVAALYIEFTLGLTNNDTGAGGGGGVLPVVIPFSHTTGTLVLQAVTVGQLLFFGQITVVSPFGPGSVLSFGTSANPAMFLNVSSAGSTVLGSYANSEYTEILVNDLLLLTVSSVGAIGSGLLIYEVH
jgi:hypothetical protein